MLRSWPLLRVGGRANAVSGDFDAARLKLLSFDVFGTLISCARAPMAPSRAVSHRRQRPISLDVSHGIWPAGLLLALSGAAALAQAATRRCIQTGGQPPCCGGLSKLSRANAAWRGRNEVERGKAYEVPDLAAFGTTPALPFSAPGGLWAHAPAPEPQSHAPNLTSLFWRGLARPCARCSPTPRRTPVPGLLRHRAAAFALPYVPHRRRSRRYRAAFHHSQAGQTHQLSPHPHANDGAGPSLESQARLCALSSRCPAPAPNG